MLKQRPVYLDLVRIRLPLPGIVSILHRISGALLFLVGPHLRLNDDDVLAFLALDEQFGEEDRVAAPDVRTSLGHVGVED